MNSQRISSCSSSVGIIRVRGAGGGGGGSPGSGGSPSSGSSTPSPTHADLFCRAECSVLRAGGGGGVIQPVPGGTLCTNYIMNNGGAGGRGSVLYTFVVEEEGGGGTGRRGGEEGFFKGKELSFGGGGGGGRRVGGEILLHDMEKTGCSGQEDQRDRGSIIGVLKRASPTHCLSTNNGLPPDGLNPNPTTNPPTPTTMHCDIRNPGRRMELLSNGFHLHHHQQGATAPPPPPAGRNNTGAAAPPTHEERQQAHPSCHIPVPRHRKPSGHADKEVMAATVLTSLSTSPLVLHPASTTPTVPEPASRGWKEALSASYSSSTSGNWSWDASDQSVPSTPSPPLTNDANKGFLLSSHLGDDVSEDVTDGTHFLFEDPIPRKRKNSMKVMFKCLWKNCEKVLSTSSGIQRHVRTVHLGRNSDSDYSDGEEDFYYSEIEVNMDSLTEGLSSLTPTSPTTAGPPPFFPANVPRSEHISMIGQPAPQPLQPAAGAGAPQDHHPAPTLLSQSAPSTLCHIRTDHAYQGPVAHVRTVSIGEKRQPASITHTTATIKNHVLINPVPKPAPGTRKPRGEAKKCRKVYGMEKRDMWCTACRWKKACQRFTD